MSEEYYVEPCEFTCAKEFLDALDETNELWRGETWLFRGQNVDKPLLPTAMRSCRFIIDYVEKHFERMLESSTTDEAFAKSIKEVFTNRMESIRQYKLKDEPTRQSGQNPVQSVTGMLSAVGLDESVFQSFRQNYVRSILHSFAERFLVAAFMGLADQVGLKVPLDRFNTIWSVPLPFVDQLLDAVAGAGSAGYIVPEEYTSIAYALARHHSVPTRLLDFTYRPAVAAYFGANCNYESEDDLNRRIVVWAINQHSLYGSDLQVIRHRRAEIGFLQAQDGAFLLDGRANEKFWFGGRWTAFDYYLEDLAKANVAYKLTLPFSERQTLLDLLKLKGVSTSALMPSFDNVANEIQCATFDVIDYVLKKV